MAGETGAGNARLLGAVQELRSAIAAVTLPLDLPGAPSARAARSRLLDQLDDYLLPRLRDLTRHCSRWSAGRPVPASPRSSTAWSA